MFAIAASFFAIFLYVTLYLQTVLGMSPIETGLVYLPGTFLVFVVSGMTAQIGARYSSAKIASLGLGLVAVGLALMLLCGVDSSWTILLPGLLVTSVGTGLFNPTGSALALDALPDEQSGLASGANDTFRQTGVAVGNRRARDPGAGRRASGGDPQAYVDGLHHALIVAPRSRRSGRSRRRGCCSRWSAAPSPTPSPSPSPPRASRSAGSGVSCGGRPWSARGVPVRIGDAVAAGVLAGAAEREQDQAVRALVDELAAQLGADAGRARRARATSSSPSISSVSVPSSTR